MRTGKASNRQLALYGMLVGFAAAACGSDNESREAGSLTVLVEAEDVIQQGLEPGDEPEKIRDGWRVQFDKYIVVIGQIDLEFSTDHDLHAEAAEAYALDLTAIPASGQPLWELNELTPGRWDVHFATPGAQDGAERHGSVSHADFNEMRSNDWTYLIDGTLTMSDGRSCPPASLANLATGALPIGINAAGHDCYVNPEIAFTLGVTAETSYGPCEIDEVPGVSVPSGATRTVSLTIHGDHLFFNGFPGGSEGGTLRLAQWLADCDLDLDGRVTREELEQIRPSDLPEMDARYQFGGSPIQPLESQSLWVYVTAQLKTQAHFQGEGECEIDGAGHAH